MLATMIERVDAPPLIWSEVGVIGLPTGTVTLLLADVEGSTGLWGAKGAALSTEEAIGHAQRGRGQRRRPSTGWAAPTPTELDVVRLLSEGLPNKDIATRLFISPRTVQTHFTHIYTKLGVSSRVQLVQEAGRHT